MKTLLRWCILALLAAALWIGAGFLPATLPVPELPPIARPDRPPVEGVQLAAILAGRMTAPEGMAYRGGSLFRQRVFGVGAILVEHPQGNLLFDTGLGQDVQQQLQTLPLLMRLTTKVEAEPTVAAQLQDADYPLSRIEHVVLTHAHWDHVSALPELSGPTVMTTRAELAFVGSQDPHTALMRSFGRVPVTPIDFSDGDYLGFGQSDDVYGDGSIVLVPVPGHTPGAIIAFVNTSDGQRYALLGDLVWQREGLEIPAERPLAARWLVDHDPAAVRDQVVHLHRLMRDQPEIVLVPAHDRRVWEQLPRFPQALATNQ